MRRLLKRVSVKAGLPPGSLVHIGDQKTDRAEITLTQFDEETFDQRQAATVGECFPFQPTPTITWLNVDGLHRVDVLENLGARVGLHPLISEDILNTDQRPKLEDHDDHLFLVLKALYLDGQGELEIEQVSIVVGERYVLSFQEKPDDVFHPIRDRLASGKGRIRRMGADYLAYSLVDTIVDGYFGLLERLGERIGFLEDDLIAEPTSETLREIHVLKREMIHLRRSVWPLREIIGGLERSESPLIQESTRPYLRDVYDHTIQIIDVIETYRDMLSGMLDMYLSSISNSMNAVMKVLTIIGTIFIPLTFLAGVYGMNFRHMPELEWTWSYPALWIVMLAIAITMVAFFRRRRWL